MADLVPKEYYILYIDILGYQQKIKEMGDEEFLKTVHAVYKDAVLFIGVFPEEIGHRMFSDNLIICINPEQENSLLHCITLAELLQQYMLEHSIFLRGAITKGLLYLDENYVFGSGLINAYRLENDIAIFPRIIVDKNLDFEMKGFPNYEKDFDGYYYADYLESFSSAPALLARRWSLCKDHIMLHKSLITESLKKYSTNSRIYQKYEWCKRYHNRACEAFGFDDLKIEDGVLAAK